MKIVILDGYTVNPGDLSWDPVGEMGELTVYDRSAPGELIDRALGADVILVNKVRIGEAELTGLQDLKGIVMLATGYDNVDIDAARKHGVKVYNAVGYGSESVAQHAIALMLAFTNRIESHHLSVQQGDWTAQDDFSYTLNTVFELSGKTLGIFGFGKIGGRLAALAIAFGMKVLATSRTPKNVEGVTFVEQNQLFSQSDFISLHAPLTDETSEIIRKETLGQMKKNAILINTGRGGLVREKDLVDALTTGQIRGAGLDVLSMEPPRDRNPLLHTPNVIITPHMAWSSYEARKALIAIAAENIDRVRGDDNTNRVV